MKYKAGDKVRVINSYGMVSKGDIFIITGIYNQHQQIGYSYECLTYHYNFDYISVKIEENSVLINQQLEFEF